MKAIDFHTHVFPDKIASDTVSLLESRANIKAINDGTLSGLKREMKNGGADVSVILPVMTRTGQFDSVTRFAVKINESEEGLVSFGAVFPGDPDCTSRLAVLKKYGIKGIKIHPDYQNVNFDDISMMRLVDEASALGFIISVHAGVDIGLPGPVHCTPEMALHVIREVHPEKLVLAHTGGWKCWDEVEEKLAGRDVYFDISFTDGYIENDRFRRIIINHGTDRILYATDSPWSGQKETMAAVKKLDLGEESEEKIFYRNAETLLGCSIDQLKNK